MMLFNPRCELSKWKEEKVRSRQSICDRNPNIAWKMLDLHKSCEGRVIAGIPIIHDLLHIYQY